MTYNIEPGIEIPERKTGKSPGYHSGRPPKYPFNKMEDGDSFYVDDCSRSLMASVRSAGSSYFAKFDPEYTVCIRKVGDGMRVWKIKREED